MLWRNCGFCAPSTSKGYASKLYFLSTLPSVLIKVRERERERRIEKMNVRYLASTSFCHLPLRRHWNICAIYITWPTSKMEVVFLVLRYLRLYHYLDISAYMWKLVEILFLGASFNFFIKDVLFLHILFFGVSHCQCNIDTELIILPL